ncbi:MAG TPA: CRISPR-associated protein Cas4 [Lachnospiraceae bacterium]|nr:CRISPR-associated protein Cas4 [Lachnospiraceae bacterium]
MEDINIRDLQHFLYCQHRWGLIVIDKVWAENIFVIKSNLMHENVHDSNRVTYAKNKKTFNAVAIYHDELGIFGVTDSLIIEKNKYILMEYKPTKPKGSDFNIDDALQVFAQKICVDSIFHTNSKGYLYYKNEKFKIELPFEKEYEFYYSLLIKKIEAMRGYLLKNQIPSIRKGQKCSGCSLKDLCMPTRNVKYNLKQIIFNKLEEEE